MNRLEQNYSFFFKFKPFFFWLLTPFFFFALYFTTTTTSERKLLRGELMDVQGTLMLAFLVMLLLTGT